MYFKQLALEMCAGNHKLIELKAFEADIETAIYQGSKSNFKDSSWNKNWKAYGENKPDISAKEEIKVQNFVRIIWWTKWYLLCYGLADSLDADNFQAKLASSEEKWKNRVPGFHEWFLKHWKFLFEESVIPT